jgi:hypothetical protein
MQGTTKGFETGFHPEPRDYRKEIISLGIVAVVSLLPIAISAGLVY